MKFKSIALFLLLSFLTPQLYAQGDELNTFFTKSDQFFKMNVADGSVNYTAISKNPALLNELYTLVGRIKVNKTDAKAYQSFWINAYNLSVIKAVVDAYPISSPMDIKGFFDKKEHLLSGQEMTLNYLENELLRANFDEARFHFVLVCGAISCPPIVNFAYTPEKLDAQMEKQAKLALNNNTFLKVDNGSKKVSLSEIFRWYTEDFTKNGKTLIDYINTYRLRKIPTDYKVDYYSYDWTLNNSTLNIRGSRTSGVEFVSDMRVKGSQNLPAIQTEPIAGGQTYTPGTLLRKGQSDFTMFNTLYTESKTNWKGQDFTGFRTTFATTQLQWTYGVSENSRVNLGVDVYLRGSGRASVDSSVGAIDRAFTFKNTDSTRFGVGAIGIRAKVSPIKGVNNFSIQSTFLVSPADNPEGMSPTGDARFWIEWDRFIWWNQFFYDKTFGGNDQFQIFLEADLLFRFKRRDYQNSHLDLPTSVFFSYFPTKKITLYVMSQYVPRFVYDTPETDLSDFSDTRTDWVIGANYTASGVGFKYQFTSQLNIELLYSNFWRSRNNGLGETFNLGIRYITR